MCTPKTLYMDELQRCADEVSCGKAGAILNNPKLLHDYNSDMLEAVWHAMEQGDDSVRKELILLLANLNVDSVAGDVDALGKTSSPEVAAACREYRRRIGGSGREGTTPGFQDIRNTSHERDARDIGLLLRMLMVRNPHLDIDDDK